MFVDFAGFAEFFLFQDLLTVDGHVDFWLPFAGFPAAPIDGLPGSRAELEVFYGKAGAFLDRRGARVAAALSNVGVREPCKS
jgi:hypothetical protein